MLTILRKDLTSCTILAAASARLAASQHAGGWAAQPPLSWCHRIWLLQKWNMDLRSDLYCVLGLVWVSFRVWLVDRIFAAFVMSSTPKFAYFITHCLMSSNGVIYNYNVIKIYLSNCCFYKHYELAFAQFRWLLHAAMPQSSANHFKFQIHRSTLNLKITGAQRSLLLVSLQLSAAHAYKNLDSNTRMGGEWAHSMQAGFGHVFGNDIYLKSQTAHWSRSAQEGLQSAR